MWELHENETCMGLMLLIFINITRNDCYRSIQFNLGVINIKIWIIKSFNSNATILSYPTFQRWWFIYESGSLIFWLCLPNAGITGLNNHIWPFLTAVLFVAFMFLITKIYIAKHLIYIYFHLQILFLNSILLLLIICNYCCHIKWMNWYPNYCSTNYNMEELLPETGGMYALTLLLWFAFIRNFRNFPTNTGCQMWLPRMPNF